MAAGYGLVVAASAALAAGTAGVYMVERLIPRPPVGFHDVHVAPAWPTTTEESRDDALRRARIWTDREPASASAADSLTSPDSSLLCRFLPGTPHGTTSKFDCTLPDGEPIKVKYGTTL